MNDSNQHESEHLKAYYTATEHLNSGSFSEARCIVNKQLSFRPNDFDLLNLLGAIEATDGHHLLAIECFSKAIEKIREPEVLLDVYRNIIRCYELSAEFEKAIPTYKVILELKPHSVEFWFGFAQSLTVMGNKAQAMEAYAKVIEYTTIHKEPTKRSFSFYALSQSGYISEANIELIHKELSLCGSYGVKAKLYFSLGNYYENNKQYDLAFKYLEQANICKSKVVRYEPEQTLDKAVELVSVFSKSNIEKYGVSISDSSFLKTSPIFIVGLPRSGSTLIEFLLSNAKNIHSVGESGYFSQVILESERLGMPEKRYPSNVFDLRQKQYQLLSQKYFDFAQSPSSERIVDKFLPNFWNIGFIKMIFPKAKIICCRKNSVDACFSLYKQDFYEGHPYAYSLKNCAHYYELFEKLMKHWDSLFPEQIYHIQYEDFVNNSKKNSQELFSYCNLDWQEKFLDNFNDNKYIRSASSFQVRSGINKNSLYQSQRYEKYLTQLQQQFKP